MGGNGGRSADIRALREGCWALCSLLLLATGGRPLAFELEDGELFLFKGTGALEVEDVCWRGLGTGAGAVGESIYKG